MFMYNDVIVEYSQRFEKEYDKYSIGGYFSRVVHILEVNSLDVEATVTCETSYEFSHAVVISTLLAALRNMDDGFIYSLARKKIESQMGFQVDDLIPGYVAKKTDVQHNMHGVHWSFNVVASVCRNKIIKPNLIAMKKDNNYGMLTIRLEYYAGVHQCNMDLDIEEDLYYDFNALNQVTKLLWANAYEKAPMLAPDLSYMRYTEGLLSGGKYHNGSYAAPKPNMYFSGVSMPPAEKWHGGRDARVSELPGVREVVKNPVTGAEATLESVIINLNDYHKWTREQIADWLETLDIDLQFKPKNDIISE